ncbi:prepilin-type N-terminal cleavage/methylation domain-containing protein [Candidatus Saccharibacteria bacterium TM7i]|nr:prepilin-type N-terminal cleavage/methylation domain-containing protein [Candidatus Saccharibacteria bacterium TM7i]
MIQGKIRKTNQGFTLIELMLAMTFVSVLLLAIAMTIIQAGNIYSKGMALRDINQSARLISDDFKKTVASAGRISLDGASYISTSVSGRLCLGNYSYLWNTIDAPGKTGVILSSDGTPITFIKIPDPSAVYCAKNSSGGLLAQSVRADDAGKVTTLLSKGDHALAITALSVDTSNTVTDPSTGQRLFTVNYSIGTGDPRSMTQDRTACLLPNETNSDPIYCSVQRFSLVVRSGGEV